LGYLFAAAYARIVTLGNDVGQPVIDDDLDLDIGIFPQERGERRQQDRFRRILGRGDPNGAGGLFAKLAYGRKLGFDFLEPGPKGAQQSFARFGRRDAARRAGQEADP
jgi:hypothetical protein